MSQFRKAKPAQLRFESNNLLDLADSATLLENQQVSKHVRLQ